MKVVIVGAGIGGLALALALRRTGLDPLLIERAPVFGEVGAGLQLAPNAVKALRALGAEDLVAARAWTPANAVVRDLAGGRLLETPLGEAAARRWGAPYLQVHRADLHAALNAAFAALGGQAPVQGQAVTGVFPRGVTLEDGRVVQADLIIGADGVRSLVRRFVAGDTPARFTGQVAWRGLTPTRDLAAAPLGAEVITGPNNHFVSYCVRGGELVNFVAVTEESAWTVESWSEVGDRDALLQRFAAWPETVRARIAAAPQVLRWALFDRPPLRRWSKGTVGLLGDAAHPMLPFFAQGAAMALEDAVILARCLADEDGPAAALTRYTAARARRTAKVQGVSRLNARLFHAPLAVARAAFGAAGVLDRVREEGARFDWLYGYDPGTAAL